MADRHDALIALLPGCASALPDCSPTDPNARVLSLTVLAQLPDSPTRLPAMIHLPLASSFQDISAISSKFRDSQTDQSLLLYNGAG